MNLRSIYGRQQMNKLENKDTVCETYYSRNKVCVPDINWTSIMCKTMYKML